MTAQTTLQGLLVNYPKPIMAKLLNSQSQPWEIMLSQHAMPSQSRAWEAMLFKNGMHLAPPITSLKKLRMTGGERVETSLVPYPRAFGKPSNISAQSS